MLRSQGLGSVASAARGILITSGTNATPIVATITAGHGLKSGDRIAIAGVTTLTSMNGEWTLAFLSATTAQLLGSAGNGAFGGTAVVAVVCDTTPLQAKHRAVVAIGNTPGAAVFVGTVVIEYADSIDATQFYYTATTGVVTAGFNSSLPSGMETIPAATAGIGITREVQLSRYMTFRCSAYTSGAANAQILV